MSLNELIEKNKDNIYFTELLTEVNLDKNLIKKVNDYLAAEEEENPWNFLKFQYITDKPKAANRPNSTYINGHTVVYDCTEDKKFKSAFKNFVLSELEKDYPDFKIIHGPVHIEINVFRRSIGVFNKTEKILAELGYLKPAKKPDCDNYAKIILDALNGFVWMDDGQNTTLVVDKFYSIRPRIEVNVYYKLKKETTK